jgi:flagellar hook-associated protein 3 FlgL
MIMRVTTQGSFERGLTTLQRRQADLAELQEQLTSGKRVARASDDPTAAARAERAMIAKMRTDADQRALDASRNATLQAETALGDAGELLQQVREHMMAAGNASYSDREREGLAVAIRGLREQLLSVANRGDGAGAYLFGGQGSTRPPFSDAPGGVVFLGDGGATMTANAQPLPLTVDGGHTWLQAVDPDTGAATLSTFDLLDRLATELETPGRDDATISGSVREGLKDVDAVMDHLLSVRARLGETLNRADAVEVRLSQQALMASADRSAAEDLDMVQAVSDFQSQQTGYDAALKAYSMVQRLSLFDYISR